MVAEALLGIITAATIAVAGFFWREREKALDDLRELGIRGAQAAARAAVLEARIEHDQRLEEDQRKELKAEVASLERQLNEMTVRMERRFARGGE